MKENICVSIIFRQIKLRECITHRAALEKFYWELLRRAELLLKGSSAIIQRGNKEKKVNMGKSTSIVTVK